MNCLTIKHFQTLFGKEEHQGFERRFGPSRGRGVELYKPINTPRAGSA